VIAIYLEMKVPSSQASANTKGSLLIKKTNMTQAKILLKRKILSLQK
jgi:hypothetical protein